MSLPFKFFPMAFLVLFFIDSSMAEGARRRKKYEKATEGKEIVMNKIYTKKKSIEIGVDGGAILNQSYINSFLVHGTATFFTNEIWGFGLDFGYAINQDKPERSCIESFYNDWAEQIGPQCGAAVPGQETAVFDGLQTPEKANFGPAYVPIREYNLLLAATAVWNPVYGKQLYFLRKTGYLDVFVTMGGGIAMSDYYPEMATLPNGSKSRGPFPAEGSTDQTIPGVSHTETNPETGLPYWGEGGRPPVEASTDLLFTLGIGQKFHFGKKFNFKMELRNYTLIGTPLGFETIFTLWGGVGFRL